MDGHFSSVANVYREIRTTDPEPVYYIRDALAGRDAVLAADIGCGAGRYDKLLFEHVPNLHLTCIDASAQMIEQLTNHLAEADIRNFVAKVSSVADWPVSERSLDAVMTFNAVHHFAFPTFLGKAGHALRDDGRMFIYTRTPEQNAGSIWGRHFPRFTEKESRLYSIEQMERWVTDRSDLKIVEVKRFRYARRSSLKRLLSQARGRHYSTFALYDAHEFEAACRTFEERICHTFDDLEDISWHDENTLLHVTVADRENEAAPSRRQR